MKKLAVLVLMIFIWGGNIYAKNFPLYVNIIWHQHQPPYFVEKRCNCKHGHSHEKEHKCSHEKRYFLMSWVRLHLDKDYVKMNELILKNKVKVTVNFSGSLLKQILMYMQGVKDIRQIYENYVFYLIKHNKPIPEKIKKFFVEKYFDFNWSVLKKDKFYSFLLSKKLKGEKFTEKDIVDLIYLFNKYWFYRNYWRYLPNKKHYSIDDVLKLREYEKKLFSKFLITLRELANKGQLSITYGFHPILPILLDSSVIKEDMNMADFLNLREKEQAKWHINYSKNLIKMLTGKNIDTCWPAEGSISYKVLKLLGESGLKYIGSDSLILAENTGRQPFEKGKANPLFFLPYKIVGTGTYLFFRDHTLSDKIGFRYNKLSPQQAVKDFIAYLKKIRNGLGADKPYVVTVILDGENCWEEYKNDGINFLNLLYETIKNSKEFKFITMKEYVSKYEKYVKKLSNIKAGSWIDATFSTWIGEKEENNAWKALAEAEKIFKNRKDKLNLITYMMAAQASDWFWWYGKDQESSYEKTFDYLYRYYLNKITGKKYKTFLKEDKNYFEEKEYGFRLILPMAVMSTKKAYVDINLGVGNLKINNHVGKTIEVGLNSRRFIVGKNETLNVKTAGEIKLDIKIEGKHYIKELFILPHKSISVKDLENDELALYPNNPIFKKHCLDIKEVKVFELNGKNYIAVKFGSLDNPFNSPRGFSIPLIILYIGKGKGKLLPGTNYLPFNYRYVVILDGWKNNFFVDNGKKTPICYWKEGNWIIFDLPINIIFKNKLLVRPIVLNVFSQDGYGVGIGVRKVAKQPKKWLFGKSKSSKGNVIDELIISM